MEERLVQGVRTRIEMGLDAVRGFKVVMLPQQLVRFMIELERPPRDFLQECNPRPGHTEEWQSCQDFTTDSQASLCRLHTIVCHRSQIEAPLRQFAQALPKVAALLSQGIVLDRPADEWLF